MENIRELAVDMLSEIMEEGSYCHLVIRSVLQKYNYRDDIARKKMRELVNSDANKVINVFSTLT